jgi:hypothetical protein
MLTAQEELVHIQSDFCILQSVMSSRISSFGTLSQANGQPHHIYQLSTFQDE